MIANQRETPQNSFESVKPFIDFYKNHKISPVSQDISDLEKHFNRRGALYRHLGIVPHFVKNKKVIEFGPGSGHNAIYTNSLEPSRYLLVDGNPTGLKETKANLSKYYPNSTNYELVESLFEKFETDERFDIVFCEAAIPFQHDPKGFLRHISKFVVENGLLVVTSADNVSIFGEWLRRLAGTLVMQPDQTLEEKMERLRPLFRDHLASIKGASRPLDDWILDNIIQPFIGKPLSIPEAVETLSSDFDIYSASPHFLVDWRWYKSIPEDDVTPNELAIEVYFKNVHNFLDYRGVYESISAESNQRIITLCNSMAKKIRCFEVERDMNVLLEIKAELRSLSEISQEFSQETTRSLNDFIWMLEKGIAPNSLPLFKEFVSFFGRAQPYLSFIKRS